MKIENLKDLESVMKLCRKHGVRSIEVDGVKMAVEEPTADLISVQGSDTPEVPKASKDDMLYWSSQDRT